jgi:hypothetical protein
VLAAGLPAGAGLPASAGLGCARGGAVAATSGLESVATGLGGAATVEDATGLGGAATVEDATVGFTAGVGCADDGPQAVTTRAAALTTEPKLIRKNVLATGCYNPPETRGPTARSPQCRSPARHSTPRASSGVLSPRMASAMGKCVVLHGILNSRLTRTN